MAFTENWKRKISLLLVLIFLLTPAMQAAAEELPEETATPETTEAPEVTEVPAATDAPEVTEVPAATESPEVTEVPAATEPSEVTEPPAETQIPPETNVPEETESPEETEVPTVPEVSEETQAPEETEAEADADVWAADPPATIAEILAAAAGTEHMLTKGTVVFVGGTQAVLQDATGGIRLSFSTPPEISAGDVLIVSGRRSSSGFSVAELEKTGTDALPVLEAALTDGWEALRIRIKGAVLGYNSLSQGGIVCQLVGELPAGIKRGDRVDAWGVLLDGVFYADTIIASEEEIPDSGPDGDWNFYFGQLHAHTGISDGTGTVEEAFLYARQVENLDFFAVTDHSDSFDNAEDGSVDADGTAISREWAAGKAAAGAVTDERFVGIFGYEMTWPEDKAIGHISTFATPGWQTRDQEGMKTLEGYLGALSEVPGSISQFNHPGTVYGDFRSFSGYSPRYDALVHLLEVGGENGFTAYDAYTAALDAGWHLAPTASENNHNGSWGSESQSRTVILARELTEEAIYEALRSHRAYATEDADLKISYRLNGRILGSIMGETSRLTAEIRLEDGSGDAVGRVEVITDGGKVAASMDITDTQGQYALNVPTGGSYYYLRVSRNGKTVAVTAPVWVDSYEDLGIENLTASVDKPVQGGETLLTLTLFNREDQPFVVESVEFSAGTGVTERITAPGSVASQGKLEIPFPYSQDTAGAVTITATVTGTIAGLPCSYQKSITLHFQAPEAELLPVSEVRAGSLGIAYRVRGYVTAGTANSHNTFPGSIYLQDDSGGIQIMDFTRRGIQVGTPMEVEGILRRTGGNLVLAMTDYEIPEGDLYRFVPKTMTHKVAMNYENHGGELLQIEGSVVSVTRTADGKGIARFTLRDIVGGLATVIVEDGIGSGAYGTNELISEVKPSKTVRAMGLLHIDEFGATVLRVRNCDEVAYIPPVADRTNPKTGDFFTALLHRK